MSGGNPERARERARGWAAKNRGRARAKTAAWKAANPQRAKASDRALYQANRTERLAYAARPEVRAKKAARMKAARAKDPVLAALKFRAWKHGITVERVKELLAAGCGVCGTFENLCLDHDHKCCPPKRTGRYCGKCVRGALCSNCNTALGLLAESAERVIALLAFVRGGR